MPVVVNIDLCLGCGACVSVCPVEALSLDADGHAESNKDVCIDCGNCANVCPVGAPVQE